MNGPIGDMVRMDPGVQAGVGNAKKGASLHVPGAKVSKALCRVGLIGFGLYG